jgi:DNA-binding CsgD family transcriptional regulator
VLFLTAWLIRAVVMAFKPIAKYKHILLYGLSLAALLFLLKWLELRFIIINHAFELYIGAIALLFTGLGIWLALKLARPRVKTIVVEKEVYIQQEVYVTPPVNFVCNEQAMNELGISKRELEVLQLIAEGLSNQEIAGRLFVSLHTIKTHSSKLFEKMEVKRRTQAIEKAKRLNIIP